MVQDVGEVVLPANNLDLMGHEALVEAHAHVTSQKGITLLRNGRIGRKETKSQSEFNIQAFFDIQLRKAPQCRQAGPEGSDSPHLTTKLDLELWTSNEIRAENKLLLLDIIQLYFTLFELALSNKRTLQQNVTMETPDLVYVVSSIGVYQPSVKGSVLVWS